MHIPKDKCIYQKTNAYNAYNNAYIMHIPKDKCMLTKKID